MLYYIYEDGLMKGCVKSLFIHFKITPHKYQNSINDVYNWSLSKNRRYRFWFVSTMFLKQTIYSSLCLKCFKQSSPDGPVAVTVWSMDKHVFVNTSGSFLFPASWYTADDNLQLSIKVKVRRKGCLHKLYI